MGLTVKKRTGEIVPFDETKITKAILLAMSKVAIVDEEIAEEIAHKIKTGFESVNSEGTFSIEEIQDRVESELIEHGCFQTGKEYIRYRALKEFERKIKNKEVPDDFKNQFISMYKKKEPPFSIIGSFIYDRTYSRNIASLNRREFFYETLARALKYNTSFLKLESNEFETLFDRLFNIKQCLSGRTYWIGNTTASKKYPTSNFNCAGVVIKSFDDIVDYFYLLSVGAGVGIRILKRDISNLPPIINFPTIKHLPIEAINPEERIEYTEVDFNTTGSEVIVKIGDSREGWIQSLKAFFDIHTSYTYRKVKTFSIDYSNIRPKGEPLKSFGGTASGYETMRTMFMNIDKIIHNTYDTTLSPLLDGYLRPIHILDICNCIASNIVAGNVRRSSCIALFSPDDNECLNAKTDPEIFGKRHLGTRAMSNNSVFFETKPTMESFHKVMENIKNLAEPGFVNVEESRRRRPDYEVTNP